MTILEDASGPSSERIKKRIIKLFQHHGLKITAETNLVQTNFLDVTLDLRSGRYWPFRKPNDQPLYIHRLSNHPPVIKKQLPLMLATYTNLTLYSNFTTIPVYVGSMPFKHKRKINRCFRSSLDVLKRAAKCVTEEGSSYRKAAANFNVDKMTLIRHIKRKEPDPNCVLGYQATALKNQIFTLEMEQQLSSHIVHLADMFFGLSVKKCKEFAFQFAAANKLSVPHSWEISKKAGK